MPRKERSGIFCMFGTKYKPPTGLGGPLSNTWRLLLIGFFQGLVPAYVIERLFWEQRGITIQQVVYCEIAYAIAVVLFEIPTGVLADKWSRKGMLVTHALLNCAEFLILIYATEFWHFALVTFLAGIGTSAKSGSLHALLYDSLAMSGRQDDFEMHVGRLGATDVAATVIAAVSGGFLADRWGFELNYWLSAGSSIVGLILALTLVEPDFRGHSPPAMPVTEYVARSVAFLRSHRQVARVVLTGMVLGAFITYPDEFWQVYLHRLSVPMRYFGFFSVALYLGRGPAGISAFRLLKVFRHETLLTAIVGLTALAFAVMVLPGALGAVALVVVSSLYGLVEPIVSGYLHHSVDSQIRATVDSFQSLGLRAASIVVGLGFGYVATHFSIFKGFGFLAVLSSLYLVGFLVAADGRHREEHEKG